MSNAELLEGLPGAELMMTGLSEYEAGRVTPGALLVAMAETRLRRAGLLHAPSWGWAEPEMTLYELLRQEGRDAYSRYNALRRELDSFLAALTRRIAAVAAAPPPPAATRRRRVP
ncbi:MAG: hypothetical protein ACRD0Y_03420 [Terriglobales bacterium]